MIVGLEEYFDELNKCPGVRFNRCQGVKPQIHCIFTPPYIESTLSDTRITNRIMHISVIHLTCCVVIITFAVFIMCSSTMQYSLKENTK